MKTFECVVGTYCNDTWYDRGDRADFEKNPSESKWVECGSNKPRQYFTHFEEEFAKVQELRGECRRTGIKYDPASGSQQLEKLIAENAN